jgi:hypothetical protein
MLTRMQDLDSTKQMQVRQEVRDSRHYSQYELLRSLYCPSTAPNIQRALLCTR